MVSAAAVVMLLLQAGAGPRCCCVCAVVQAAAAAVMEAAANAVLLGPQQPCGGRAAPDALLFRDNADFVVCLAPAAGINIPTRGSRGLLLLLWY
jgi:hypothetical protein